uniref:Uncharacterized protein n=1 Tax=Arundo donax TaxID=35708 RepID=A0A0A9H7D5_ARUDO
MARRERPPLLALSGNWGSRTFSFTRFQQHFSTGQSVINRSITEPRSPSFTSINKQTNLT